MSLPAIEVRGLSKRYVIQHEARHDNLRDTLHHQARRVWRRRRWGTGFEQEEFWALRDVSFTVERGAVLGVVGRNGAGKSTLLKLLSRISEPTAGEVTLRGRVASLLEVGTGFHPELSGRENIFLNGAILGMSRAEIRSRFDEIVAFAEVDRFLDTPVKRYSSGMYVRLAFSVAAHLEPEILIVDEVLAVGDIAFQKKCLGKIENVARTEGRTILFVSHNLASIRQLCQRAILLDGGRLVSSGSCHSVLDHYQHGLTDAEPAAVPKPPAELRDKAYATRVQVESLSGKALPAVAVGEPWRVRVGFHIATSQKHFVVAVGLRNSEGTAIQTVWATPRAFSPGDYDAVFTQDQVVLEAGTYTVVVGLSESDRSVQHFEATRLDIDADNARGYFPATSGRGIVLNSMAVDIQSVCQARP